MKIAEVEIGNITFEAKKNNEKIYKTVDVANVCSVFVSDGSR